MWKPSGSHVLPGLWLEIGLETANFVVSLLFPCHFHGFHMDIMWFPGQHHMVSNVDTMWFSSGHYVISMLIPHGFHVDTTSLLWFPHDYSDGNVISMVRHHKMEIASFPHHFYGWKQCRFHLETTWFPCVASFAPRN